MAEHPWDALCRVSALTRRQRFEFVRRVAKEIPLRVPRGLPPLLLVWKLGVHVPGFGDVVLRAAEGLS